MILILDFGSQYTQLIARRLRELKIYAEILPYNARARKGFHWGMATPHQNLPRGTRIRVGVTGTLEEILFGPSRLDDGSQNLVGALKTCMGSIGASSIKEMQLTEVIIAPSIKTEGKIFQKAQQIGMGKF